MTTLTSAQVHALAAVAGGEVVRIYRRNGNIFRAPKGVGANVLWRLAAADLIADGPTQSRGVFEASCAVVLTGKGKAAMNGESVELRSALNYLLGGSNA